MKRLFIGVVMLLVAASVSAQYKVGDFYNENGKQGIVFEVDESGQHGKIVSMVESSLQFGGVEYVGVMNIRNGVVFGEIPMKGVIYEYEFASVEEENKDFHTCYKFTSASKLGEGPLPWAVPGSKNLKRALRRTKDEADGAKNQQEIASLLNWQEEFPAFAWCASLGEGWYLPALGEWDVISENKEQINASLAEKGGVPLWVKLSEFLISDSDKLDENSCYGSFYLTSSCQAYSIDYGNLLSVFDHCNPYVRYFVRAVSAF